LEWGIDKHAIAPAIRECEALGFIEITEHGTAGNREFRRPNLYRLTYRATEFSGPTDEWRRVKTDEDAAERVRAARKIKTQWGKPTPNPVGETHTETGNLPVGETHTTVPVGETHTTSISREGCIGDAAQAVVVHLAASRSRSAPPRRRSERAAGGSTLP
jgi:hypothetical protein